MSEERASSGVLAWTARQLATLLVLVGLVALYRWGAANEWKLPFAKAEEKKDEDKEKKKEPEAVTAFPGVLKLEEDDSADLAGIETAPVKRAEVTDAVEAPAVLAWDQTRFAHLAPRAGGPFFRITCKLGQRVKKGETLLLVASADVGKLKADFLTAAIGYDVKRRALEILEKSGAAIPERQLREAAQAVRESRVALANTHQALANLGLYVPLKEAAELSDDELTRRVQRLGLPDEQGLPATLLPLVAPFAGDVVRLDAVVGEMGEPSKPVVAIADSSAIWCLLDVRQEEAAHLAPGQAVTFTGRGGPPAPGVITWVSPEADPRTRTVRARAELKNPSGLLRPGAFGTARVVVGRREALLVPAPAVQFDGKTRRVFLRRDGQHFEPRLVLVGPRSGADVELIDPAPLFGAALVGAGGWRSLGLLAAGPVAAPKTGDAVVTVGSHALLGEMYKSRLEGE